MPFSIYFNALAWRPFSANKNKQVLRLKAQQRHVETEKMLCIAQHQEVYNP